MRWFYGVNLKQLNTNFNGYPVQLHNSGKFMAMLEESVNWMLLHLPIKCNSFLYEPLQEFILLYHQHGLMAYSESKWYESSSGADKKVGAQVLSIQMLSAGFIVWIVCVLISVSVFLIEILVKKARMRKLKQLKLRRRYAKIYRNK